MGEAKLNPVAQAAAAQLKGADELLKRLNDIPPFEVPADIGERWRDMCRAIAAAAAPFTESGTLFASDAVLSQFAPQLKGMRKLVEDQFAHIKDAVPGLPLVCDMTVENGSIMLTIGTPRPGGDRQ